MLPRPNFSPEELSVARRLEKYFSNADMDFLEKVFQAQLIASYELESGQPATETERIQIMTFMDTLDTIWHKLTRP
ncbi:MAG TPA: hypothetical protein DER60_02160 [Syntrophomonas sp.]|nr:hypothetical protein [Syntrophomonas sp.]